MDNKIYPFKFLDAYTAEDKDIFFGRDEEVRQLYQMIYQSDTLLLYGASGTGKTSLIQCGLASQFEEHDWLDIFIRRNKNLNESLNRALIAVGGQGDPTHAGKEELDWLEDIMGNPNSNTTNKTLTSTQLFLKNIYLQHFRPIYLIFDQFEELFILGSEEEQAAFITTIQEILKVEQPVKLIFSIREEYLGSLYEFEKVVPELLRKKLRIDPMNLEKVKAVVLGVTSSSKSIVHIHEPEADAIAEQVFEKIRGKEKTLTIQLPYLQVFLDKFYRHISKDQSKNPTTEATLTLAALAEIGDIGNILRDFLDEQIVEIANDHRCDRKTIWQILSPFVTVDGTKEPISLKGLHQQLPDISDPLTEQVVLALMNRRILRYLEDEELYEIAHDSLALRIAEKRSDDEIALLEVRNLIKSQSLLKDETRELFSEKQLLFISPFLGRLSLSPVEKQLIAESQAKVVQAQREARRRKILIAALILLIFAVILGFALYSNQKAIQANKAALAASAAERVAVRAQEEAERAKKSAEISEKKAVKANDASRAAVIVAEQRKQAAQIAERLAKLRQTQAVKANEKNEKIIKAMDFYGGNLALAFHNGKYGFINKDGAPVIAYEYDKGEPFDAATGYAEMEIMSTEKDDSKNGLKYKYIKYLVDTEGTRYQLVDIPALIKNGSNIQAVLSKAEVDSLQAVLLKNNTQSALLRRLDVLETAVASTYEELFMMLDRNEEKLALDFSGLTNEEVTTILKRIAGKSNIEDRIELLFLGENPLEVFPPEIAAFKNLKWLDLSGTEFQSLPASIGNFHKLERLDLRQTYLKELPSTIAQLQNLKELYLSSLSEKKVPNNVFELKNLRILALGQVEQTTLPATIGQLDQLIKLSLAAPLVSLPKEIFSLKNLESLLLEETALSTIPTAIAQLRQLREFSLEAPIKRIPEELFQLRDLERLTLSETNLKVIPKEISRLVKLKSLVLGAPLENVPSEIFNFQQLLKLELLRTAIKKVPSAIGQLKNLEMLFLDAPLESFPVEVFKLKKLKILEIGNGQIQSIPDNVGQLRALEQLIISSPFKDFPTSIFKLKELQVLKLLDAQLQTVPDNFKALKKLRLLSLSGSFRDVPTSIFTIRNLEQLTLESKAITTIPEGLGALKNLGILTLSGSFEQLPAGIGGLTVLKILDIDNTKNLRQIPDVSTLKNLWIFSYVLHKDEYYDANVKQLLFFKEQLPDLSLMVTDAEGDFIFLMDLERRRRRRRLGATILKPRLQRYQHPIFPHLQGQFVLGLLPHD